MKRSSILHVAAPDVLTPAWERALHRCAIDGYVSVSAHDSWIPIDGTFDDSSAEVVARIGLKPRLAVGTSVRFGRRAELWGDTYFARDIASALRWKGWRTEVATHSQLRQRGKGSQDAVLYLRGLRPCPSAVPHVLWVISHDGEVAPEELRRASATVAAGVRTASRLGVALVQQATNPRRFRLPESGDRQQHKRLLFVGHRRGASERLALRHAIDANMPVHLVGRGWPKGLPLEAQTDFVDNEQLSAWYFGHAAVLNDHWPAMIEGGTISNRIFDVLASGGRVITDQVEGLSELGGGDHVMMFADRDELGRHAASVLNEAVDVERAARVAEHVHQRHSFAARADQLDPLLRMCL